jgi:N-methylhydantoinase B/oxoprolinase/acetone carboxylase alpha subunit
MSKRKKWLSSEIKLLITNYETNSIYELMELFPTRSQESINNKIKRLKANGKISEEKSQEAITRAYSQRHKRSPEC